jgi:TPR repeat protein
MRIVIALICLILSTSAFEKSEYLKKQKLSEEDLKELHELKGSNVSVACFLGDLYRNGRRVAKDHKKAIEAYSYALETDQGALESAKIYHRGGNNVPVDVKHAEKLYKRVAMRSDLGKYIYGMALIQKLRGKPDYAEALKYFISGSKTSPECSFRAGLIYQMGQSVDIDYEKAYAFHENAINLGKYGPAYYEAYWLHKSGQLKMKFDRRLTYSYCGNAALKGVRSAQIAMVSESIHLGKFKDGYFWFIYCKLVHNKPPEITPYESMFKGPVSANDKKEIEGEVKKIIKARKFY